MVADKDYVLNDTRRPFSHVGVVADLVETDGSVDVERRLELGHVRWGSTLICTIASDEMDRIIGSNFSRCKCEHVANWGDSGSGQGRGHGPSRSS